MSVSPYEDQLHKLRLARDETKLESLAVQKTYVEALCGRHLVWAAHTEKVETAAVHFTVVLLLQEAREKYKILLHQNGT